MRTSLLVFALISSSACLSGCGGSSLSQGLNIDVLIPFKAVAGGQSIRCGKTITGLGIENTNVIISNFRMFVHDFKLITDQGIAIPVTLDSTRAFQNKAVALLDFRDTADINEVSTEICPRKNTIDTTVNPNYNDTIKGSAVVDPAYTISSIEFTLGVPFDLNHDSQTSAVEPLRNPGLASGMAWSWQNGYKFVGIDVLPERGVTRPSNAEFTSTKWNIHLGSTGCSVSRTNSETGAEPETCNSPNRSTIRLPIDSVALGQLAVQVDYAALIANNNLEQDKGGAPGCMSGSSDPECESIFEKLGLPWGEDEAVKQTVFSIIGRED